jgi:hypothetical protein
MKRAPAFVRVSRLFLVVSASLFLVQCMGPTGSRINVGWHFVIPNNYEGFLVIGYDCMDGEQLLTNNNTIQVNFNQDGTFCATELPFSSRGQYSAQTQSGQHIEASGILWEREGFGFHADQLITVHHEGARQQFGVYWVGDLEYFASIRNKDQYMDQLNSFLKDRFGVSLSEHR